MFAVGEYKKIPNEVGGNETTLLYIRFRMATGVPEDLLCLKNA